MATIVKMPEVLAGASEAALATWLIKVGDRVQVGDALAEIETEKATVEYHAESNGIVGRTLIDEGVSIEVGAPIAVLIAEGENDAEIDAALAQNNPSNDGRESKSSDSSAPPFPHLIRDPESAAPIAEVLGAAETGLPEGSAHLADAWVPSAPIPAQESGRIIISPLARQLAKRQGIDLAAVTGTGPGGRIVRRDLEAVLVAQEGQVDEGRKPTPEPEAPPRQATTPVPAAVAAPTSTSHGYIDSPHTGMRRAIARRLTASKSTVPHFYLVTDCHVDALIKLRTTVNETSPFKISLNDFVVKAAAAAFTDVPEANVIWTEEAIRRFDSVDIAIAVTTETGLLTPVVRDASHKTLGDLSRTIAELVSRARKGRLRQNELEGGSFSVTNLGMYGTKEFTAILNAPQSAILAVGAAQKQPVVDANGELSVATVMTCTLSVDHRAVDGALAAQWLSAFTQRIENPISILL
jgi:pyruvate dehydrogenase E2 component (dihydrolipoamide acetyltransferase)